MVNKLENIKEALEGLVDEVNTLILLERGKPVDNIVLAPDYIVESVLKYFTVSNPEFLKRDRSKLYVARRKYCIKLLRDYGLCTWWDIADRMGFKRHRTAMHHHKSMTELLSGEVWGDKSVVNEYNKIVKHLITNSGNHENKDKNQEQKAGKAIKV
uniref:Putative DNA replication initiation protein n=1 Tax=viral metagenome TaxID=1070528 RepID=A0A6M3JHU2_9ZZZZ